MGESWIPSPGALYEGNFAGLRRATRDIFTQLRLLARPHDNALELPRGLSDVGALMHITGCSRREARLALEELANPQVPLIAFEGEGVLRYLTIVDPDRWSVPRAADSAPGERRLSGSAERMRRLRDKRRRERSEGVTPGVTCDASPVTGDVTPLKSDRESDNKTPLPPVTCDGPSDASHAPVTQAPEGGGNEETSREEPADEKPSGIFRTAAAVVSDPTGDGKPSRSSDEMRSLSNAYSDAVRETMKDLAWRWEGTPLNVTAFRSVVRARLADAPLEDAMRYLREHVARFVMHHRDNPSKACGFEPRGFDTWAKGGGMPAWKPRPLRPTVKKPPIGVWPEEAKPSPLDYEATLRSLGA